jgi:transposase
MGKEAKYVVRLSADERQALEALVAAGRAAADKLLRARMLLKADVGEHGPGWTDAQIVDAFEVSESTVHRLRQRLVEAGPEAALVRKSSTQVRELKLDGAKEARLIAIACGKAPEGFARWTMQLLADRLIELKIVEEISDETVRRTLKKTNSSPGCIANG